MLTEFEVRRRIASIRASRLAPIRKARLLLRIGKLLTAQVHSLRRAKQQIAQTDDKKAEAGLTRMTMNTEQLNEDVRDAAFDALHPERIPKPYLS